jgi:hypothetical protein
MSWRGESITAACEPTDCQPQYYFGDAMFGFFVLLPGMFVLGWVATWRVWSAMFRSTTVRKRLRRNVAIALATAPIVAFALGYFLTTVHGLERRPVFVTIAITVPSLVAAMAGAFTLLT